MLFLPWRNKDVDIIAGYPNYATRYRAELEYIMEMKSKYSKCAQTLEEAVEEFNQYGPPAENVAPTAEQERMEAENEGPIEERYQDPQDLDEHADLIEQQNTSAVELSMRFNTQTDTKMMSNADYYQYMRNPNEDMGVVVFQGPGFKSRWRCMFFTLVVLSI